MCNLCVYLYIIQFSLLVFQEAIKEKQEGDWSVWLH